LWWIVCENPFWTFFYPYEKLCIDESLLLFKGRCHFKQYIPNKRSRFGIKSFLICDCKTGFVQDFIIYSGKKTEIESSKLAKDLGKSGEVVLILLKPYLGKGHTVITDNWYTSPNLYRVLSENHTNGFGTAKKNRKGMPIIDEKLQKGEWAIRSSENMMELKFCDKKRSVDTYNNT
jgi:Transposase IS4